MIHSQRSRCLRSVSLAMLAAVAVLFAAAAPMTGTSSTIVISQVYGGGGNTGATYTNDFIELYNRGAHDGRRHRLVGAVRVARPGTTWQVDDRSPARSRAGQLLPRPGGAGRGGDDPLPTPGRDRHDRDERDGRQGRARQHHDGAHGTRCPTGGPIVDFVGYGTAPTASRARGPAPALTQHDGGPAKGRRLHRDGQQRRDFTRRRARPRNRAPTSCGGAPRRPTGVRRGRSLRR